VLSRAVDFVVRRLRAKIEVDAADPDHILTVFGTGHVYATTPTGRQGFLISLRLNIRSHSGGIE